MNLDLVVRALLSDNNPAANYRRSRACGNLVFTGSFALLKHGSPRSRGRRYNLGGMSFSRMRESSVYGFIRSAQTWITACVHYCPVKKQNGHLGVGG